MKRSATYLAGLVALAFNALPVQAQQSESFEFLLGYYETTQDLGTRALEAHKVLEADSVGTGVMVGETIYKQLLLLPKALGLSDPAKKALEEHFSLDIQSGESADLDPDSLETAASVYALQGPAGETYFVAARFKPQTIFVLDEGADNTANACFMYITDPFPGFSYINIDRTKDEVSGSANPPNPDDREVLRAAQWELCEKTLDVGYASVDQLRAQAGVAEAEVALVEAFADAVRKRK